MIKIRETTYSKQYLVRVPNFKLVASTNGRGLWSDVCKKVVHARANLSLWDTEVGEFYFNKLKHAELRVYFTKKYWDVDKHGLIYTDPNWIKQARQCFVNMGFSKNSVKSIDYTENGMQGNDYVSLDVESSFIKQIKSKLSTSDLSKIVAEYKKYYML